MTSARHKLVVQHPLRRRIVRLAVPAAAATALTGGVVGLALGDVGALGVVGTAGTSGPSSDAVGAAGPASPTPVEAERTDAATSPYLADRSGSLSRSARRVTLRALPKVEDREFMTTDLNLWPAPRERGKPLDVLAEGGTVALTGVVRHGFAQILRDGRLRWVKAAYLSDEKPVERTAETSAGTGSPVSGSAGTSFAPCPDGSGTEAGLTSSAVRLFRAVCNAFPALTTYGGWDAHGEHSSGRAIDFMTSDPVLGQAIADWARAHASELNIYDILWAQHIWTQERASEGWRFMPDRGSATANHYDHVHIAVY